METLQVVEKEMENSKSTSFQDVIINGANVKSNKNQCLILYMWFKKFLNKKSIWK